MYLFVLTYVVIKNIVNGKNIPGKADRSVGQSEHK
jgi:hypothetical protein